MMEKRIQLIGIGSQVVALLLQPLLIVIGMTVALATITNHRDNAAALTLFMHLSHEPESREHIGASRSTTTTIEQLFEKMHGRD